MLTPLEEMDHLFELIFPRGWVRSWSQEPPLLSELAEPFEMRMPRLDVLDGVENLVIRAEVPGVDKKDLDVSVNEASASIKGKVICEAKEEKADYYRCEVGSGEFSSTIALPCAIDGSKASARLKDGILELILPKVGKSQRRTIRIS
jgi:HSP20 family protein